MPDARRTPRTSPVVRRRQVAAGLLALVVLAVLINVVPDLVRGGADGDAASAPTTTSTKAPADAATPVAEPSSSSMSRTPSASPTEGAGGVVSDRAGVRVPQSGNGTVRPLDVPGKDSRRQGRTVRYTVETEGRLKVDTATFVRVVREALIDRRGWEPVEDVHFVHVTPRERERGADVDLRITLASPTLTDRLCFPADTFGEVSCFHQGRAVINAKRWQQGVSTYSGRLAAYRVYLINHEVGHSFGHGHASCAGIGRAAPVMLQQTLRLERCTPWPYPARPSPDVENAG
ncbi:DUF3152 domain-containing protein [Janibacter sp. G1551]|uniref:DUF3152 domain-containing protein n=1 Tax=Janibacter sp. G1551 TaxID=3420440 RepID=UPI003CFE7351